MIKKAQISNLLDAELRHAQANNPILQSILITVFSLKHVKKLHEGELHIILNVDTD